MHVETYEGYNRLIGSKRQLEISRQNLPDRIWWYNEAAGMVEITWKWCFAAKEAKKRPPETIRLRRVFGPSGAIRTRGFQLPKLAPYRLGYTRKYEICCHYTTLAAAVKHAAACRLPPKLRREPTRLPQKSNFSKLPCISAISAYPSFSQNRPRRLPVCSLYRPFSMGLCSKALA